VTVARSLLQKNCIFVGLFWRSIDESSWLAPLRTRTNLRGCHASMSLCVCVSVSVRLCVCPRLFLFVSVGRSLSKKSPICVGLFFRSSGELMALIFAYMEEFAGLECV